MILISSCLAGLPVRYDGGDCNEQVVRRLVDDQLAITVCPEILGGLSTPRNPAEIINGDGYDVLNGLAKVIDNKGNDVTEAFIEGAQITLNYALTNNVTLIVLKENSPSCGSQQIYDGSFSGTKKFGNGVTAALLKQNGINVVSETTFIKMINNNELVNGAYE